MVNLHRSPICAVDGCDNLAKRYRPHCGMHIARIARHGDPHVRLVADHSMGRPLLEEWVATRDRTSGCWVWPFAVSSNGYGRVHCGPGDDQSAHRVALELDGRPPGDLYACHHCDNPPCVNPAHLYVGTAAQNTQDALRRGRSAIGERVNTAKLTAADVVAIRALYASGTSAYRIAKDTGMSTGAIRHIVKGRTWKHVA